ncbi:efflux RND transporter permease subunit [Gilvimarinus sp. SDUM040013]|uniref:Efflux RND transporter permease subunit n=1 Tax=Gilvimarinus gilvus TaxID=3058038 RepID=A0ABU4RWN0_9GAMM|nr:efflux RND transporter permease subunit [Gilvimarinus sp. SDUM040013]MDO3385312.1 efflux RND transporter permease subunit [Gilvimarinus sp. SDUM040013]MDX6849295.1 efflux RND transporter permease subunit [Gilvimarinus sp. SDUM040013]
MIEAFIRWSLGNRLLVLAAAALLLLWGGWSARQTPIDVFPDLTAPVVTVVAEAHGMPPEDVERMVTFPIETAMNGASGVRRVRSNSGVGIAVVSIEFEWGTDIYRARQIVSEKLQTLSASLPPDLPAPVMAPVSSIMGEIMFIALTSDRHSEMDLKTTADWVVRRRLLAVPGIAEVIPNGGETKQFQVIASPERLSAYSISLSQLSEAVSGASANAAAGFIVENLQEYLIQGLGRVHSIADIEQAVVTERNGVPVLVRDIADVLIGPAQRRGTAAYNGESSVVLGIQKQPGINTLDVTRDLDDTIAELQKTLPEGMVIATNVFRQSNFIQSSIDNLVEALRDGAVLVVAIMFAFLLSARATGIALMAIPLSVLSATLTISWLGGSLNTMTLGGIAIAMGALVDDAIIVVENIVRRLRENNDQRPEQRQPFAAVILQATREIQGSIVFATLIIILVFLPLFFLSGVEGRLLQPLGLAYVVSLAASLLVALTVTPVLCLYFLPKSKAVTQEHDSKLIRKLKELYRPCLQAALDKSGWVIGLSVAALAIAAIGLAFTGRGFLPEFNEGSLTVSAVTLSGTALETSDEIGRRVEKMLLAQPEVVATARRTGRAELDPHAQQVFASEIEVTLKMADRSKSELLTALRSDFAAIPGTNVVIGQPISHRIDHMLSGTRANIAIKIFGDDLVELRKLGRQVEALVTEVPGAVDVAMEQQSEIPFVQVRFNRAALANYGLSMVEAANLLETAFTGKTVGRLAQGQTNFDLVVRLPDSAKQSMETLKETLITLPSGATVPIEALADVEKRRGANTISREDVQRKLVVMTNVSERDLVSVVEDIQTAINQRIELPTGYFIEYGGQFESAQSTGTRLLMLGMLVILGIFFLLVTAFNSLRDASLIMLNLPLAVIGGVAGVWVLGGTLTIAAVIGFIALFGIATRNGVILIDHIRQLSNSGLDFRQAIVTGAEERLIPILMTALATALALIPLAMAAGEPGSEIQAPMAIVILWGLLSSTVLNMLVVPAVYLRFANKTTG